MNCLDKHFSMTASGSRLYAGLVEFSAYKAERVQLQCSRSTFLCKIFFFSFSTQCFIKKMALFFLFFIIPSNDDRFT